MRIKIGFFAIMLGISLLLNHSLFSFAAFLAALTHELGHILIATRCGIQLRECKIGIYGAGLVPESGLYSYRKEILLCLAGPLVNLLCAGIGMGILGVLRSDFLEYFSFASLSLGVLNLLPIKDFDGGRILASLLCMITSPTVSGRIIRACSLFFVCLLWMISVYLLLRHTSSLSLFIFSVSLFARIFIPEG